MLMQEAQAIGKFIQLLTIQLNHSLALLCAPNLNTRAALPLRLRLHPPGAFLLLEIIRKLKITFVFCGLIKGILPDCRQPTQTKPETKKKTHQVVPGPGSLSQTFRGKREHIEKVGGRTSEPLDRVCMLVLKLSEDLLSKQNISKELYRS